VALKRVFASKLRGLSATGPDGVELGRVHDVVVTFPRGRNPRVTGIVVHALGHRRRPIFVNANNISEITSTTVRLISTRVSMRPFTAQAGENRILAELLDRTVTEVETGKRVRINDIAIERGAIGWEVDAADVVEGGGPLRRGRHRLVEWEKLQGIAVAESAASRAALLEGARPADVAQTLMDERNEDERAKLFAALPDDVAADALQELPEEDAGHLLATLPPERAGDVLDEMDSDEAADLLGYLPQQRRTELLELMEPDEAEDVRRLLKYRPHTAGGLMSAEPVIVRPQTTVAEVIARLREPELSPSLASMAFVTREPTEAPTGRFLGVAHLQALLRVPVSEIAGAVIDKTVEPLSPELDGTLVAQELVRYELMALPVCDPAGRLLGAVTIENVMDHLLPRGWRAAQDSNGQNGGGAS
jgi:CBS domain-containing protein